MIIEWSVRNPLFPQHFQSSKRRLHIVTIDTKHERPGKVATQEYQQRTYRFMQAAEIEIFYHSDNRSRRAVLNYSSDSLLRRPANLVCQCFINNIGETIVGRVVRGVHHRKVR